MSDYGAIDLSGTLVTASGVAACRPRALTVHGRSTQAGTPTPDAPVAVVSVANPSLWSCGRNLIVQPYVFNNGATVAGITWTVNADGSVTANGTATNNSAVVLNNRAMFGSHPKGTYTLSGSPAVAGCYVRIQYATAAGGMAFVSSTAGNPTTFTTDTELQVATGNNNLFLMVPSGTTVNNAVFRPMLNAGSTAHAYEPYTATVTPIDLDGHELRSLPDGTCDELRIDGYGHAVLTKRVGSVTYDGTENWTTATVSGTQVYRLASQMTPTGWDTSASGQLQRLCNRLTVARTDAVLASTAGTYRSLTHLSVNWDGTNNDLAAFKAALAATPLEIVYLLATPQAIDLGTVDMANLTSPELTAWVTGSPEFELTALLKTGRSTVMWDGEELGAGWTFVSDRREQLLPTDVATIDVPGRDGALFGGVTRAVRQVTLALYVLGPVGERAPHVRELAARLAVDGPRPLMFSDEAPLWRMAVPNAESESEVYYDAEGYTDVEFVCPDPWLYGEERSVTVPSGGSVTFTVGGTAPTWPTITASATGGSQGAWILRLDDSSKGIYAAIASGVTRPVVADCDARTLTVNDATSMLAPSYDWPELTPGTHTLAMTQGTGAATVTWTERWW